MRRESKRSGYGLKTAARKPNRLLRIVEYERPWVGRVGLALVAVLWFFVTAVGFAIGIATGLTFLIVGAALIGGEVWIEHRDRRNTTFVVVWRLFWRIAIGIAVIVLGAIRSSGWAAVVPAVFGGWLILTGLFFAWAQWNERGSVAARDDY